MAKYNGWTNYETWLVNLWMDRTEFSQDHYRGLAEYASSEYELAQMIKDQHEETWVEIVGLSDGTIPANVFTDLMTAAMSAVNWEEIAGHIWDEIQEDNTT